MSKSKPWWTSIYAVALLAIAGFTLFGLMYRSFAEDVNLKRDIQEHTAKLVALDAEVDAQDDKVQDAYVQQQLIQKDVEYIKAQSNQILDAIKAKR